MIFFIKRLIHLFFDKEINSIEIIVSSKKEHFYTFSLCSQWVRVLLGGGFSLCLLLFLCFSLNFYLIMENRFFLHENSKLKSELFSIHLKNDSLLQKVYANKSLEKLKKDMVSSIEYNDSSSNKMEDSLSTEFIGLIKEKVGVRNFKFYRNANNFVMRFDLFSLEHNLTNAGFILGLAFVETENGEKKILSFPSDAIFSESEILPIDLNLAHKYRLRNFATITLKCKMSSTEIIKINKFLIIAKDQDGTTSHLSRVDGLEISSIRS